MKNRLTKTAYLNFLDCPNEFWLANQPSYVHSEPTDLEYEHLRQQGYQVERYIKELSLFAQNDEKLAEFQRVFQTADLYARSDAVITDRSTGVVDLYEIKSSSKVKPEHLADVAFQRVVAERSGFTVGTCNVITMNGEYVRQGEIDPEPLFIINDVTATIADLLPETELQIEAAKAFANTEPIPSLADYCGKKLDCEFIKLHFPDLPDNTVFNISRLTKPKLKELLDIGVIDIRDIPDGFKLSEKQQIHVTAAKLGRPLIEREQIAERLRSWPYPHHFLDYETFQYAIPQFDGIKPFQQMCFQYSLHTIHEPGGDAEHKQFLARFEADPPRALAQKLRDDLGDDLGTVFVWYDAFEKTRNEEMAEMFPEFADFFADVNAHTVDLMKVFSDCLYVDPAFKGSSSIKKVLPVLCPELSYGSLGIGDGLTATISWYRAATWDTLEESEKEKIFTDLEIYCHLDTLAMVEIFRKLAAL